MASIQDDRFYPVTEVADLIGVNYRTVLNEIHGQRLHAVAVGPKPIYRVPGWALRDYQAGRAPRPAALVASIGGAGNN
ncbi:helix-turn-helix domain-containing protein [Antiquaquibacter soli]|uniref:Helix-turn-helix domain-containing protein n=1 Tax=Antiquaquibacter soli TaxID=3064523 RepID=A0ABT9BL83_9MICO|nr:helix-turn-helix domain-containing protein [Protaetiibacter sp. WY-16]MDO7881778.1 helix-turn-helix domain-containing protein [Protaetiibacter sp. WY-16]